MRADVPAAHAAFLRSAVPRLGEDPRVAGIAAGGSYAAGTMDEKSDLDLVIAVEPSAYPAILDDRVRIAEGLGPLLAAFTGEHVGEPRLLICLYGPPLLHVDLKFVALGDAAHRVEDPVILWEREGALRRALSADEARYPAPDPQWIEDRFWVWVHYVTDRIARGELFEAQDSLAILRSRVLGPLALQAAGARPQGVRRLERLVPAFARELEAVVPAHDARSCALALRAAAEMYCSVRAADTPGLTRREAAEGAAMEHLDALLRRI